MSPTSKFQQGESERRAFISIDLYPRVILSEVRRQPNEVEGPLHCLPYQRRLEPSERSILLCASVVRKELGEQKLLGPQLLNHIPQLSSLLKLELLGRLPHIALE